MRKRDMAEDDTSREAERNNALHRYDVLDTPPEESFDRITRLAKTALQMPIVLVSLVDADRQWFKSRQGLDASETPRDISFCTHAIEHDVPFIVRDALKDERFRDNPLVTGAPHIRSYAGIPLKTPDGHNIGTLCAIDTKQRDLSEVEITLLRDLARLVVDELELRQIATTDSLTGAQTRRSFDNVAQREMERARRYGRNVSFIAFDIDHFKLVNDTYGHPAGDHVLQTLSAICRSKLRSSDMFARMGGEEFMIVLPEIARKGAMELAERLRQTIADTPISDTDNAINITASFGVAVYSGEDETLQELLGRVDRALYEAKTSGRNRTVFADGTALSDVA
ncbi:MAG: sensor domain-containing diguanylate cyclase [Alphaproteobacteria bacterium]|nr:sensor domain-containing diguanylate cyclase [Alphaproteobacteria bacterium]